MKYPPVIVVQLIHIHGPMKGEIVEFSGDIISIGRNPGSSLRFPKEMTSLSRRHADITREGNQFKLTDYSANGTFVNGKRVKEALLREGDVLEFSEGGPKVSFLTRMIEVPVETHNDKNLEQEPCEQKVMAHVQAGQPHSSVPIADGDEQLVPCPASISGIIPDAAAGGNERIELSSQKVSAPLIIQYGPTIRSFRELPVIIGKKSGSDFVLSLPSILDRHMEIVFSHGKYWIKDLSGLNHILINGKPIEFQAPLNLDDIIAITPQGPSFCFLGEGRLAEVAETAEENSSPTQENENSATGKTGKGGKKSPASFWSKLKEKF